MWKKSKFLRTSRAFQNFCRGHCSPLGPQVPPHPGGVRCDAWWGNEDGLISKSSIRLATWDHPMAIEWPRVHSCMMQTMCMMIDKPGSLYVRVEYQVFSSMTIRFWLKKNRDVPRQGGPRPKRADRSEKRRALTSGKRKPTKLEVKPTYAEEKRTPVERVTYLESDPSATV